MQMGGTGSRGILRVTRTASNKASGVNADSSSRGCARRGMGFEVTAQVYRNLRTRLRDGGFGKSRHGRDLAPIGQGGIALAENFLKIVSRKARIRGEFTDFCRCEFHVGTKLVQEDESASGTMSFH